MGNLTELLAKLQPAVYQEKTVEDDALRNSSNKEFVQNVACINVKRSVKAIVERSFMLEQMIENGEIAIIGAMHDLESGIVEFYEDSLIFQLKDIEDIK